VDSVRSWRASTFIRISEALGNLPVAALLIEMIGRPALWLKTIAVMSHWSTLNPVLLAGRPIYYGWPYYAWSAGHATQSRELRFRAVYAAEDSAGLRQLAQAEGIAYIVVDRENRHGREYPVNEAVIAATFPLVFSHPEREVRIYRVQP